MTLVHVVLFKYRDDVDVSSVEAICQRIHNFKQECLHPKTGRPYIKSIQGGRKAITEPWMVKNTLEYGYVFTFESQKDLEYFAKKERFHVDLVAEHKQLVAQATIFDFVPAVEDMDV